MPMPKASMLRETAKIKTAAKLMLPTPFPPILWETDKNGVCSRARPHIYKSGRQAPNPKDKNSRLILRFLLCEGIIGRSLFRLCVQPRRFQPAESGTHRRRLRPAVFLFRSRATAADGFWLWGRFLSFCLKRPVGTGKPAAAVESKQKEKSKRQQTA